MPAHNAQLDSHEHDEERDTDEQDEELETDEHDPDAGWLEWRAWCPPRATGAWLARWTAACCGATLCGWGWAELLCPIELEEFCADRCCHHCSCGACGGSVLVHFAENMSWHSRAARECHLEDGPVRGGAKPFELFRRYMQLRAARGASSRRRVETGNT